MSSVFFVGLAGLGLPLLLTVVAEGETIHLLLLYPVHCGTSTLTPGLYIYGGTLLWLFVH